MIDYQADFLKCFMKQFFPTFFISLKKLSDFFPFIETAESLTIIVTEFQARSKPFQKF